MIRIAHVALRLLERARERGQVGLNRGGQQAERQHRAQQADHLLRSRAGSGCPGPAAGCIRSRSRHSVVVMHTLSMAESGRGQPLPGGDGRPRRRVDQQRLQRAALALARGGVGGDLHPAGERRQHDEQRDEVEDDGGALLGARDLHLLHPERRDDRRAHAPRRSAAARPPRCCSAASSARTRCTFGPRGVARAVGDHAAARPASTRGTTWRSPRG